MPKPVAIYVRVSSDDQTHAAQEEIINKWLESSGFDPARIEWYRDVESGKVFRREGMDRLEKDIFDGKVKTLVVYKLDRISRNMLDGMNFVARLCDKGCRVVSVTEGVDVTGTMGRMMAAMLFGFAEMELKYRAERQAAGIAVAKRKGIYKGRTSGTTKGKPERARELKEKGLNATEIATSMGVSLRTVFRYIGA